MKRILTSILALTLFMGAVQAQGGHKGHKEGHAKMAKTLNLTEAQKTELKQQRESMQAEIKAVKQNGSLTQDQARAQRKAIHEKYKTRMQAVLTPEQKAKAAELKKDRQATAKDRRKNAMQDMSKELSLSADQQKQMQEIQSSFQSKRAAIRSNEALSREEKRESLKNLARQHKEQVKAVLNDEQEQKAKEWMKDRRHRSRK